MPDPVQPREGEVAFAVSVATLYDLTIGRVGWDVRLTQHSHPTKPTLTLANRTQGGPVLNILPWNWNDPVAYPPGTLAPPILAIGSEGISSMRLNGWLDMLDQTPNSPVPPPPAGSDMLRMYHRAGQLFFRIDGSEEEYQIPVGVPPGPSARYAYWLGGG